MYVTMSMREYDELKASIEGYCNTNELQRMGFDNSKRHLENKIKALQLEVDKYKKVNDVIVDFFKEHNVSCEESISQSDKVLKNIEQLVTKLFDITSEQFLLECSSCGGKYLHNEIVKCAVCGDNFCNNCDSDNKLVNSVCEWCREVN